MRVCSYPGCPAVTTEGVCPQHRRAVPDHRESAARRGYGSRWTEYSRQFRRDHPLCATCLTMQRRSPSTLVDHVIPVTGPDDPLFWDERNHQALCRACHAAKTAREGRTQGSAPAPRAWWFV